MQVPYGVSSSIEFITPHAEGRQLNATSHHRKLKYNFWSSLPDQRTPELKLADNGLMFPVGLPAFGQEI